MPQQYVINYSSLKPCDIILDRDDSKESQLIRKATSGLYSHARLYVDGTIIEAEGLGVQAVNPQRLIYQNKEDVMVLRYDKLPDEQCRRICEYARSEIGKEFSLKDVKKRREKTHVDEPNREYCSRLVALSYKYAGIQLVENPQLCSPEELRMSSLLTEVPNMVHIAEQQEINVANREGLLRMADNTNEQAMITVSFLQEIRNASQDENCDIQTETQINEYLNNHPSCDDSFTDVLRNSKYFVMWKMYEEQNPWEFDYNLMIIKNGHTAAEIAKETLMVVPQPPIDNWIEQKDKYQNFYNMYHFKYYKAMIEMYEKIIDSYNRRQNTLKTVIKLRLEY